jgi:hypothetical protein
MDGPLFVTHKDVPYLLTKEFVIDSYNGAARISEYDFDGFFFQCPEQNLRPGNLQFKPPVSFLQSASPNITQKKTAASLFG